jgi:transketolase
MTEITPAKARTFSRLGQRGSVFGIAVLDAAEKDKKLNVITADLATLSGLDRFRKKYPEQFYNIGIAEQNMLGIASGMASEGFLPVVTTYATFLSMRSCEQIRHYLGYMKQKVILVGTGAGLVQAFSGNTHYSIEDLAIMRSIPNITVLSPSDAGEAIKAFEAALSYPTSVYIRLTGGLNCPIINNEDYIFEIGKATILREGEDLVLFATGILVSNALSVAELLAQKGLQAKVINMHTIKPIDAEIIINNSKAKLFVSIEEHNIIGGLGGAIAEEMSIHSGLPPLLRLGIKDVFNLAGDYENLLEQNNLLPHQLYQDIISHPCLSTI